MIQREALKTMITLSTTSFGLVAALAWNSAITELFKEVFGKASGLVSLFLYAAIVTIVAVTVTSKLGRMAERLGNQEEQKKD